VFIRVHLWIKKKELTSPKQQTTHPPHPLTIGEDGAATKDFVLRMIKDNRFIDAEN
jgi:hypothetical protein